METNNDDEDTVIYYEDDGDTVLDIDRQVGGDPFISQEPFLVEDEVVPGLGDLTPLLITSALVVGLRLDIESLDLTSEVVCIQRGFCQRDLPGHHRSERHRPRRAVGGAQPQRHS